MVRNSDDDAAGEIERHDDESGDRIALDELSGSIHRSVEIGLALDRLAFASRAIGIEESPHERRHR